MPHLRLYDFEGAPNPRRVRVFAAEKGIELERVMVDLAGGEHKSPEFVQKNPSGKIPVLELEDGTCIGESIAICRYLEGIQPEPNLFGATPIEAATIEMHHRHVELELLSQVGISWVNGPVVAKLLAGRVEQIPAAKERSDAAVNAFYQRMDGQLSTSPYIAGERFTVADITALITVDFAGGMVGLRPAEDLRHLWSWHENVSARPSASA